jgi:hypothetical protein
MLRRFSVLAALLLVAAIQTAIPRGATTASHLQDVDDQETPEVRVSTLGEGSAIQLYQFEFDPGGSIEQQLLVEPMLVHVFEGSFVFYIPNAAGGLITFRGDEPPVAIGTDSSCELPPFGESHATTPVADDSDWKICTFDDTAQPAADLDCQTVELMGEKAFQCSVTDRVAFKVQEGTTLVLPGPTICFVCALKAALSSGSPEPQQPPSRLEVTVAAPPGKFEWLDDAVPVSAELATQRLVYEIAVSGPDPCKGKVR